MALYRVNSGDLPLASDLNQLVEIFNGKHDIGDMILAPIVNTPAAIGGQAVVVGTAMGVGAYQYVVTHITGYRKTSGQLVYTGETLASPPLTVTTTTGNQAVNLSVIPVSAAPSVIGRRIYRTVVGGAAFKLLAEIPDNVQTTYADRTADASLGAGVPPTANTTGTTFLTLNVKQGITAG